MQGVGANTLSVNHLAAPIKITLSDEADSQIVNCLSHHARSNHYALSFVGKRAEREMTGL